MRACDGHHICFLLPNYRIRFKTRVPDVVNSLPDLVQKFVRFVCKQGIDPKKAIEVGNLGYDSGYDW